MKEINSEKKQADVVAKNKKRHARKNNKTAQQGVGYLVETPKEAVVEKNDSEATVIPAAMMPNNWDMANDSMIELFDDILYEEERLVVKNTGFKSNNNEPIGESVVEKTLVKSSIKFGVMVTPSKSSTFNPGDIVAVSTTGIKVIDFSKNYAVVPHYAIYGKVGKQIPGKPATSGKNLFGRLLQRLAKRLGFRNVHK